MYLKRNHDLTISSSEIWRILHKVGLGRLPSSQRYKSKLVPPLVQAPTEVVVSSAHAASLAALAIYTSTTS